MNPPLPPPAPDAKAALTIQLSQAETEIFALESMLLALKPGTRDHSRLRLQLQFRQEDRDRLTRALAGW